MSSRHSEIARFGPLTTAVHSACAVPDLIRLRNQATVVRRACSCNKMGCEWIPQERAPDAFVGVRYSQTDTWRLSVQIMNNLAAPRRCFSERGSGNGDLCAAPRRRRLGYNLTLLCDLSHFACCLAMFRYWHRTVMTMRWKGRKIAQPKLRFFPGARARQNGMNRRKNDHGRTQLSGTGSTLLEAGRHLRSDMCALRRANRVFQG